MNLNKKAMTYRSKGFFWDPWHINFLINHLGCHVFVGWNCHLFDAKMFLRTRMTPFSSRAAWFSCFDRVLSFLWTMISDEIMIVIGLVGETMFTKIEIITRLAFVTDSDNRFSFTSITTKNGGREILSLPDYVRRHLRQYLSNQKMNQTIDTKEKR